MAVNEQSGAKLMGDLDARFFDTLERFRRLVEAGGDADRYRIEHEAETYRPVAIWLDGERYLVDPVGA